MPVLLDNASQGIGDFGATATSGSVSETHNVNPQSTGLQALIVAHLMGNNNISAATLSATFGGDTAPAYGSPVMFASNQDMLAAFLLPAPPTGARTWQVSASGITAQIQGFWLMAACLTFSGVLTVGTPVDVTGDTAGPATNNSVTVPSSTPACRVITAHAVREPFLFSQYNQNARAAVSGASNFIAYLLGLAQSPLAANPLGGELLVGDAPGAASVTGTAVQPSTPSWGAIGIPMTPAPVIGKAALSISTEMTIAGSLTRVATPSQRRTWVISG